MGIEIDFLAVGEASKSGDAIAIRFGNLHGRREEQTVITIDGGTKESGDNLVEHIKTHFGTTHVDLSCSENGIIMETGFPFFLNSSTDRTA